VVLRLLPLLLGLGLSLLGGLATHAALPILEVTGDDTVITQSCRIRIAPGRVIADPNTNGVLHLAADHLVIEFLPGSELRGAAEGTPGDQLRGIGIRLEGHRGVTLRQARVHGFFNGLLAIRADQLHLEGGDFSDNYRQRLRSTPAAEDGADWLFPHHNDERKWRDEFGGAVCVEASEHIRIRNVRVRRGQNGILLDRVNASEIYDNDCSFLSGWGLALWRSSRNVVSRNALDFCVRGHVEGVYNRGQDSAGILCFEQCNENLFAENSATHGGDGFFGFAGREALGEGWMEAERQRLRRETGRDDVDSLIQVPEAVARDFSARGCNRNVFLGNDFSYAAAHGFELTFSEGNVLARNRIVGNAICGVWAGYSSDQLIVENEFADNGGMAYGLERGAINGEHAANLRILRNTFRNNRCGIHLWWDNDAQLLKSPGVAGLDRGVTGNVIAGNTFSLDDQHPFRRGTQPVTERFPFLQLRDDGTGHVHGNRYVENRVKRSISNAVEFAVPPGCEPDRAGSTPAHVLPRVRVLGQARPVGARAAWRGRDQIRMDEWGPWDHTSPFVRSIPAGEGELAWEVARVPSLQVHLDAPGARLTRERDARTATEVVRIHAESAVTPYRLTLEGAGWKRTFQGTLLRIPWKVTFFPWTRSTDPRENLTAWRALGEGPEAVKATISRLDFNYGGRGPRHLELSPALTQRGPGAERFGMIAQARLRLPAGRWRFRTLSDDGVRVMVGEATVIENWNWHGPTPDEGVWEQPAPGEVDLRVEHFEIDGHSVLRVEIEPER
jgi:parallel beta-helix repeat protein